MAGAPSAAEAGFRLTQSLAEAGELEIGEAHSPFYWLNRSTPCPDVAREWLPKLLQLDQLRVHLVAVRAAYEAVGVVFGPGEADAHLTIEELDALAAGDDLVAVVIDHISSTSGSLDPESAYRSIAAMPEVLAIVWAAWWLEAEWSNGGFNQYFWNSSGQFAIEAVAALDALGRPERADLVRSATDTYVNRTPELQPLRDDDSLEAWSASYELEAFDELDERFASLTRATPISVDINLYLRTNLAEVATALEART